MNVSQLFAEFDPSYMVYNLKPNTIAGYRVNYFHHICPYIGSIPVDALTYKDIDWLCSQLSSKGLSSTSIRYVLATLRKALSFAV